MYLVAQVNPTWRADETEYFPEAQSPNLLREQEEKSCPANTGALAETGNEGTAKAASTRANGLMLISLNVHPIKN